MRGTTSPDAFVVRPAPGDALVLRAKLPLDRYPPTVCGDLVRWARSDPTATFLCERRDGVWLRLDYGRALERTREVAAGLLSAQVAPGLPLAIVAGNGLDHALIALGALYAGIPIAPLSTALASPAADRARLRDILGTLRPAAIFAPDPATADRVRDATRVRIMTDLAGLTGDVAAADAAFARVGPATIAKIMFTSGTAGSPKGVITTNGMLSANQTQATMAWPELPAHRPAIVDWLPWSHTMGGSHIFGMVLRNGGTLYVDDGGLGPEAFAASVRNLREISPTMHFSVPRGFTLLLEELRADSDFATAFFRRLIGLGNAAAALPDAVRRELIALARRYAPQAVRVTSSWGMTETAPMATTSWGPIEPDADTIGTPVPGLELKLVPSGGRCEIRVRGPNVTPGYWRDARATRGAFDEDGFLRTGDAGALKDPADPSRGLLFEGRLAENFKLATGTWVNVGALRLVLVERGAPLVDDVVITGHDSEALGALVFLRFAAAAAFARVPEDDRAALARHPSVREFVARVITEHNAEAIGSSTRIARALVLADAPDRTRGEVTPKGSLNQRRALELRADAIRSLHGSNAPADVLRFGERRALVNRTPSD